MATIAGLAEAKRIYSYRDEAGVLHFTDRKPDTDQPVDERQVRVDDERMVDVRQDGPPEARNYYFFNRWHGPVQIKVAFGKASNVRSEPSLPASVTMHDTGEQRLLTVYQDDPRHPSEYRLQFSSVPGDPDAEPDVRQRYQLPFRRGKRFLVGQGFGGTATHTDEQSHYAVDIGLPAGSPVLAARDGVVMHVAEDFFGGGEDMQRFGHRANHVRILHADGTMAVYAHLQAESVLVKPGRAVVAGEIIALSGNTGYSTGPHLHFVVQHNAAGELRSLPFRFDNGSEDGLIPRAGAWVERRR